MGTIQMQRRGPQGRRRFRLHALFGQLADLFARERIPEADGAIPRGRSQDLAVGRGKGQAGDFRLVADQRMSLVPADPKMIDSSDAAYRPERR